MKATIKDVAKEAGVSVMTVSRVINRREYIAPVTKEKVLRVVKKLNYMPNKVARSLVVKKTNFIGLLVPDIANPFFGDLVKGAEGIARKRGYGLILGDTEGKVENEKEYIEALHGSICDGIILVAPRIDDSLILELNEIIPIVLVDRSIDSDRILQVWIDNVDGAFQAVEHLIKLGHRRIGFLTGPQDVQNSFRREEGYRRALKKHQIPFDRDLVVIGDFYLETGQKKLDTFFSIKPRPTAIFASNDLMALGLMQRAKERGLKIPNDLSIVGFDDIFLASMTDPPLTTVCHPTVEMGIKAIGRFLDRLDDIEDSPLNTNLANYLIIRESTQSIIE